MSSIKTTSPPGNQDTPPNLLIPVVPLCLALVFLLILRIAKLGPRSEDFVSHRRVKLPLLLVGVPVSVLMPQRHLVLQLSDKKL